MRQADLDEYMGASEVEPLHLQTSCLGKGEEVLELLDAIPIWINLDLCRDNENTVLVGILCHYRCAHIEKFCAEVNMSGSIVPRRNRQREIQDEVDVNQGTGLARLS